MTSMPTPPVPPGFTRCQDSGKALPTTPQGLREAGNAAVQKNDFTLASHMYTLGVDLASRGLKRDSEGRVDNSSGHLFQTNQDTGGELAKLLANRSLCHLRCGDQPAALEDASNSVGCDPTWEKAHLRVLAALEALGAPASARLAACEQGLAACLVVSTAGASGSDGGGSGASPGSALEMKLGHLKALALAESKKTSSGSGGDGKSPHSFSTTTTPTKQPPPSNANGSQQEQQAQQQQQQAPLEAAFRVAEDPLDPRYAMACADIGAAYAVGAHGVAKDLSQAEHFLSLSAKAGDVMATRNLGLVLLDLNRPEEAAEQLRAAVEGGDQEAKSALAQLATEADVKSSEARKKLRLLAAQGDSRAVDLMRELGIEE